MNRMDHDLSFADFRKGVCGCLRSLWGTFRKPDEDMMPMLHCWVVSDGMKLAAIDTSSGMKEKLPQVMIDLFRQILPDYAAFITGAWVRCISLPDKNLDDPMVQLALQMQAAFGASSHPEAKEILQVIFARPGHEEVWNADVTRRVDQPPLLGEFEKLEADEMGGRMNQMLVRAFEACSKKKARKR